jgi:hypothetical protein
VALALTEQTLAKILIIGSGLSVKSQCRLLRKLANAVDPPPPPPRLAKRAAARARWNAWAQRRDSGQAMARVTYSGVTLAKLIMAGWLARNADEVYSAKAVGEAITTLLAQADLPLRK